MKYQSPPGVIGGILLSAMVWNASFAQSPPQFLDCSTEPVSLCVNDEGVRLPASNQFFLGDLHPDATSCSVHVTQKTKVRSDCVGPLEYEVLFFIHDTSAAYVLQTPTIIQTDSLFEAELIFDTELSPESFIQRDGLPYTTGCMPYHRVRWIVRDECGNESVCEKRIKLFDCKSPFVLKSPVPPRYTINYSGVVHSKSHDYIVYILDDCSSLGRMDISFSFDRLVTDTAFYCHLAPALGVELPITLWVADQGIDVNCDGRITWDERNKDSISAKYVLREIDSGMHCGIWMDMGDTITGHIKTFSELPISDAHVYFSAPGQFFPTFITAEDGMYSFNNILISAPGTIKVEKNDDHRNGVSTLDMVNSRCQ
jgi:hypothetical protein